MSKRKQKAKKYSAEFKIRVMMDIREASWKLKGMSPVQYRTHSQSI